MNDMTTPKTDASPLDDRERELKFEVAAAAMPALTARLKGLEGAKKRGVAARLVSVYFDTDDLALCAAGVSLRIRRQGRRRVQTIKYGSGAAGLFDRSEWERTVRSDHPILTAQESAALAAILGFELGPDRPVAPVFSTTVRRSVYDVIKGELSVEVALDEAVVEAGANRAAFCELEMELVAGDPEGLFRLAREIADAAPLRLGVLSKSARGYALLGAKQDRAVKAGASPVQAGMDVERAFLMIVSDCVDQFRRNETLLLAGPHAEALHQARVALRRLRSAFALFKGLVADAEGLGLRDELKWLAGSLGRARDLDVFMKQRLKGALEGEGADLGRQDLVRRVEASRAQAYEQAMAALNSKRALDLMLDLAEWAAAGDWRFDLSRAPARSEPVDAFAGAILTRRLRRLKKEARHLARLDPETRHQARIDAKKLRYASDFFENVYPDARDRRHHAAFVGGLAGLQENLGNLNDIETARTLTRSLARDAAAQRDGDAAFSAGMIAGEAQARAPKLLAAAEASYAALMKAKPFWG